ncbi:MAG: hypothetical protein ACRYHQ_32415, partial [Janthinobacterium lividum]
MAPEGTVAPDAGTVPAGVPAPASGVPAAPGVPAAARSRRAGPAGLRPPLHARLRRPLRPWAVSWLQVAPLALILLVLFALPTVLFFVISFFDYDRVGIYPAFLLTNYTDLLSTPATLRVYVSSLRFAVIVWAITLVLGFCIAH